MTSAAKTAPKQPRPHKRGRPFRPGQSGNAAGRPKGARNRATALLEMISDADLKAIQAKIVDRAKAGDLTAAKLIFDRLVPLPKSRPVSIALPSIGQWDGAATVLRAYHEILGSVANGEISPEEAIELVSLVEAQRTVVKEICPSAMYPKPTAEQLAEQRRQLGKLKVLTPFLEI